MKVNFKDNSFKKIEPDIEYLDRSKIKTYISKVEKVFQDGQIIDKIVVEELTPENDPRTNFVAEDFALSVILNNEGIGALKECPSRSGSVFDNIDRIDETIEQLETYKEDL